MRIACLSSALFCAALFAPFARAENILDELLADYKKFELPLPHADAKLVRVDTDWSTQEGKKHRTLGFLLKPGAKGKPSEFLIGTLRLTLDHEYDVVDDAPGENLAAEAVVDWMSTENGGLNVGLPLAIQCHARGWDKLAEALLEKSLNVSAGHHFSLYFQRANLPPRTALATIAFAHYGDLLYEKDSDWKQIVSRMKSIAASEKALDNERTRALIGELELSTQPGTAKPGSVEALIDQLVTQDPEVEHRKVKKGASLELTALGFDAVPALILHLNDHRRTRYKKQGFNNFPTWQMRVCDVVGDILQSIAGDDLGKDWLRRQQGWEIEKAYVEKWFEKVKSNEQEYLVQRALKSEKKEWPNEGVLRILGAKYPRRLLDVYRDLLDHHANMQSHPVVSAMSESTLPKALRIEALLYAGRHENQEHRRAAFWALKDLDHAAFVELLLATVKALPVTPEGKYWSCREASFIQLLDMTDDKRVWQAMLDAARRADPGFRMQLLQPYWHDTPKLRRWKLTYLANFIDDETIRDVKEHPEKFEGPYPGFDLDRPQQAIWEQAATSLASYLDMNANPNKKWTDADWEKLRREVKEVLKKENIGTSFE